MNSKGPAPAGVAGHPHPQQNRMIRRNTHLASSASAVPLAELSSAISFLGESALTQACDLLLAQSEELFGSIDNKTTQLSKGGNGEISGDPDGAVILEKNTATKREQTTDQKAKQEKPTMESVDETQSNNQRSRTCTHKLSLLYEKCKNAHNIILKAEETGMFNEFPQGGVSGSSNFGPGAGHPSPLVKQQRQNSTGGISSVMPPPSLSSRAAGLSSSKTPSLLRSRNAGLSSAGGNHAGLGSLGSKSPALMRRKSKKPDGIHGGGGSSAINSRMIHRSNSGASADGTAGKKIGGNATSGQRKPDPPPEVLNFLKALNSRKSGNDNPVGANLETSNNRASSTATSSSGSISISANGTISALKRKSIPPPAPPSQRRKPTIPPPPPPKSLSHPPSPATKAKSSNEILPPLPNAVCSDKTSQKQARPKSFSNVEYAPSSNAEVASPSTTPAAPPSETPEQRATRSAKQQSTPSSLPKVTEQRLSRSAKQQSTPSSSPIFGKASPPATPKASTRNTTPAAAAKFPPPCKAPEGRRSSRSKRSSPSASFQEKMYGIGEEVYVKMEGKHYAGIVKNVDYGSDTDGEETDSGKVMYEVEFSDGEIWDIEPKDMLENDDD